VEEKREMRSPTHFAGRGVFHPLRTRKQGGYASRPRGGVHLLGDSAATRAGGTGSSSTPGEAAKSR